MPRLFRNSSQRNAVKHAILALKKPVSPNEILDEAKKSSKTLGIATVYRALKLLTEDGSLQTVQIPGETTMRYEAAHSHHHHHFKCERCGNVEDIEGCVKNIGALLPKGFVHHSHDITIYGLCGNCSV